MIVISAGMTGPEVDVMAVPVELQTADPLGQWCGMLGCYLVSFSPTIFLFLEQSRSTGVFILGQ